MNIWKSKIRLILLCVLIAFIVTILFVTTIHNNFAKPIPVFLILLGSGWSWIYQSEMTSSNLGKKFYTSANILFMVIPTIIIVMGAIGIFT